MGNSTAEQSSSARAQYQAGLLCAKEEIAELATKNASLVWLRTVCFVAALLCLVVGYGGENYRLPLQVLGWLAAVFFLYAIVRHEHLRLKILMHQSDQRLFERLLARLDRNWSALPESKLLSKYSELTFADDLDVAGSASLLSLVNLAGTKPGQQILQQWIAETPSWPEVIKRQSAVKLLTEHRDLRLDIIKTVIASSDGTEDVYGLPQWAATPAWLPNNRLPHMLSYLGPGLVLLGVGILMFSAATANKMGINVGAIAVGSGFLVNILVTVFWGSWIHDIFQQVTGQHLAAYRFAQVFESFEQLPEDQGLLSEIRHAAIDSPNAARRGFPKLLLAVRLANLQRDPLMYIVYLMLQLTVLWDFRILKLLEKWKSEFGPAVENWFEMLGTCEALISGSTLADEYPDWTYPQPVTQPNVLMQAKQLGHPLLPDAARVSNDVTLLAEQPLLLVTGSNMAGKSTFMRAVGLNLLLARIGGPVCAQEFCSPLFELATSIRVRDSLRDGVSFFMAELKRLKEVVDLSEQRAKESSHQVLFLLDEILQGTNSQERQIAVATVLGKLLGFHAVGLVSTHDLDLATADEVKAVSQVVHFREFFETVNGKEVMRFDYRIRPGSTPTTNALKLLKLVGLTHEA